LDPSNPNALHAYSLFLAANARLDAAVTIRDKLNLLDPLVPSYNTSTALILLAAGETDKALTFAQTMPSGVSLPTLLMRIYSAKQRFKDAATSISTVPPDAFALEKVATATRLLRMAPSAAPRGDYPYLASMSVVFLYVDLPERALDEVERDVEAGFFVSSRLINIWQPDFGPVRKTQRFKTLMRNLHLVDYWRVKGWPKYCHPVGAGDFACN
jgi:hypothetical protein